MSVSATSHNNGKSQSVRDSRIPPQDYRCKTWSPAEAIDALIGLVAENITNFMEKNK